MSHPLHLQLIPFQDMVSATCTCSDCLRQSPQARQCAGRGRAGRVPLQLSAVAEEGFVQVPLWFRPGIQVIHSGGFACCQHKLGNVNGYYLKNKPRKPMMRGSVVTGHYNRVWCHASQPVEWAARHQVSVVSTLTKSVCSHGGLWREVPSFNKSEGTVKEEACFLLVCYIPRW